MSEVTAAASPLPQESERHVSETRRVINAFLRRKISVAGLVIIVMLFLTGALAPVLAPYPYDINDIGNALQQPSQQHWLGTDAMGRDQLSRIIYGAQTSLIIGFSVIAVAAALGITLGMLAGYFGGWTFVIIMRINDAFMAFPMMLAMLLLVSILGAGIKMIVIALGIGLASGYVRMTCGQVLAIRENDYILAGRAIGATSLRIMFRHLLPNAFPPLIILMTTGIGMAIMSEAGLSFLGLGIPPPQAAWGAMVNKGYPYLLNNPVLSFAPGLAIMLVVFAFTMMGDGLRDALDPRLKGAD